MAKKDFTPEKYLNNLELYKNFHFDKQLYLLLFFFNNNENSANHAVIANVTNKK